jgi:hypothetical protein
MTDDRSLSDALKRPEGIWTLASNAIPVVGVLAFGWSALALMVFYWIENVLIGAFNVAKILIAGFGKRAPMNYLSLVLAPFFVFHYGLFCFVHGVFIFAIFKMADLIAGRGEPDADSFDLLARVVQMLEQDTDLKWAAVALLAVMALRFGVLWLGRGAWRDAEPLSQMFEPYGRVIVLHLTIFLATIPVLLLGQPVIAVFLLAVFKTGLELGLPWFQVNAPADRDAA